MSAQSEMHLADVAFDEAFDRAAEARDEATGAGAFSAWARAYDRFIVSRPETLGEAADKLESLLAADGDIADMTPVAATVAGIAADLRKPFPVPSVAARLRALHRAAEMMLGPSADATLVVGSVLASVARPRLV